MALLQKDIRKVGFIEKLFLKFSQPSLGNKTNFFRLLAVSQKAGLGLREALIGILKSERHTTMKQIIKDLVEQINQ
jgi:type II secretory pathway component PulF